jgi:hypothetical protein
MTDKDPTENDIKGSTIEGGFFIYRANPDKSVRVSEVINEGGSEGTSGSAGTSASKGFSQDGEIVGMVVIKKYGEREYFAYSPINQSDPNPGNLITYFVDTSVPNPHDIDPTNVFDIMVFQEFIQKIIS